MLTSTHDPSANDSAICAAIRWVLISPPWPTTPSTQAKRSRGGPPLPSPPYRPTHTRPDTTSPPAALSSRRLPCLSKGSALGSPTPGPAGLSGTSLILFPSTDFLFRRYQPSAHPLCGAGALKMSLLPSPHSLHPLPPSQGGRGSG